MKSSDREGCAIVCLIIVFFIACMTMMNCLTNMHQAEELRAYNPELTFRVRLFWGVQVELNDAWVDWDVYQENSSDR